MSDCIVIVTDQVEPFFAGHEGVSYQSPPQPYKRALAWACALVGLARLPHECGPWRQARLDGTRVVQREVAP